MEEDNASFEDGTYAALDSTTKKAAARTMAEVLDNTLGKGPLAAVRDLVYEEALASGSSKVAEDDFVPVTQQSDEVQTVDHVAKGTRDETCKRKRRSKRKAACNKSDLDGGILESGGNGTLFVKEDWALRWAEALE